MGDGMPGMVYRAAANRVGLFNSDRTVHLVREGSEASLCGLPASGLGPLSVHHELVCEACLEWLPRRLAETGKWRVTAAQGSRLVLQKKDGK